MEIQVKIAKILESQSFVSKKNGLTYVKHHFLGVTGGQYPKQIAFSVMGDDKWKEMAVVVGKEYVVSFDVTSREWQGKWFTDVSCWRCVAVDSSSTSTTPQSAYAGASDINQKNLNAMLPQSNVGVGTNNGQDDGVPF